MKRVTTINNLDMIQCGDYMWRILLENDGSEVYQLVIANKTKIFQEALLISLI